MLMQQELGLGLTQQPVLTQGLRQFVKLLALNKLDLKGEIYQELSENPLLETSDEAGDDAEASIEPSGAGQDESVHVSDSFGESGDSEPSGEVTPDPFGEIDQDSFFEDDLESGSAPLPGREANRPSLESFLAGPPTLSSHLKWQLSMSPGPRAVLAAAEAVIGNLNQDGYLTASLEEIRETAGVRAEEARVALELVQTFDPPGVAAHDLRECLLIQLRECESEDGIATSIVKDCFTHLENKEFNAIAHQIGRPLNEVEQGVALIRSLDPRPGQRYGASENRYVEPDVYFVQSEGGFRVVLDESDLPELRLNRRYRRLLNRGNASREVRDYIRERQNSAIQLLRSIEDRRRTIRSVCESIARRQKGFLSHGVESLRPMLIKEVAEEIGVHPSTVSRAVANKYGHTDHGVYALRFFFSEAGQGSAGASMPTMLLKLKVKAMIEQEDVTHPLTDDHISKVLGENGISVTRRTVAKYRGEMNIPSTHRRREKRVVA